MSDELRELYQQVILDHNKKPRNFHKIENATHSAEGYNRAGGKVWEVEKLSDGKWDGGNNPDGVYWWLIKDKDGVVQYTGGLTLLTKRVEQ